MPRLTNNVVETDKPEIWFAVGVVWTLYKLLAKATLTVTSMKDGKHMKGSKHATGDAFDSRVQNIPVLTRDKIVATARELLKPLGFDVVSRENPDHQDHDHYEYDPKGSATWLVKEDLP